MPRELTNSEKGASITTPFPDRAWVKVCVDLSEHEGKQWITIPDIPNYMSNTTSGDFDNKLKDIFARWGMANEIVSDSGAQFSSDQFAYALVKSMTSQIVPPALIILKRTDKQKAELSTHRKEDIKA